MSPTKGDGNEEWRGRVSCISDDCVSTIPSPTIKDFTPAQRINLIFGKERGRLRLCTCFILLDAETCSGMDILHDFGQRRCIPQLTKELVTLEGMKR